VTGPADRNAQSDDRQPAVDAPLLSPVTCHLSPAVLLPAVESEIARLVSSRAALIPQVHQHLVQAGGKRLRPTLTILSAQAVGDCNERAIWFAALVEITHLASLLHDDVVDNATIRRGQPAVPVRWGNGVAVLVADWLVAQTYGELIPRDEIRAIEILASTVRLMCEAELRQIERRGDPWRVSEGTCLEIIAQKTGGLMAAACELGGLAGGGTDEQLAALRAYGVALGTAFQIQDDLLDLSGDPTVLGKQVGSDIAMGQPTLPVLYALRASSDGLLDELNAALQVSSPEELNLPHLRNLVEQAGGITYARQTAESHVERALQALADIPAGPPAEALRDLARQAIDRAK